MYWTLDKKNNKAGIYSNRKEIVAGFPARLLRNNLNYHFAICKKMQVEIDNILIIRFLYKNQNQTINIKNLKRAKKKLSLI